MREIRLMPATSVAEGEVDILGETDPASQKSRHIARLDAGQAFGEMALLDGGTRTATARVTTDSELLVIDRADFEFLVKFDPQLERAVERLSHSRALINLSVGGPQAQRWV